MAKRLVKKMVKCCDCDYWSWDWFDDGEEFQCCLYWWFTKTEIYPDRNPNNPCWEYDDWNCEYFKEREW